MSPCPPFPTPLNWWQNYIIWKLRDSIVKTLPGSWRSPLAQRRNAEGSRTVGRLVSSSSSWPRGKVTDKHENMIPYTEPVMASLSPSCWAATSHTGVQRCLISPAQSWSPPMTTRSWSAAPRNIVPICSHSCSPWPHAVDQQRQETEKAARRRDTHVGLTVNLSQLACCVQNSQKHVIIKPLLLISSLEVGWAQGGLWTEVPAGSRSRAPVRIWREAPQNPERPSLWLTSSFPSNIT